MQVVHFKNFSIAAVFVFALSGCSVSPSVDAASWSVDAVSYLLTGKGAMDHAVSAATRRDCALMRMIKNERVCLPRDEDVAGDRLVFEFASPSPGGAGSDEVADGDPMRVDPAIAEIVEPLGGSVSTESPSMAVAAAAADATPVRTMSDEREPGGWRSMLPGLMKDKPAISPMAPDRATRLWLPVEE